MLIGHLLAWICFTQSGALEIGKPVEQEVATQAVEVHTPKLDANYAKAPTFGVPFKVISEESGWHYFDLQSYDFDAYLVLFDAAGKIVAEDDDGLFGSQSRLTAKLESNQAYQLTVCALHGARGKFLLEWKVGEAAELTSAQKFDADVADSLKRIDYLKSVHGEKSLEAATAMEGLGLYYYDHAQFQRATEILTQSLVIWEKIYGPDHLETAIAASNLASILHAQGELSKARPLFERVLRIRENNYGTNHAATAMALNNLAGLLHSQGNYAEAIPLFEKSSVIVENLFGPNHPNVGLALNNLASVFQAQGKYEKALPMFERTLEIWENNFGPGNTRTATCLNNLALLLQIQGNYSKARPLFERALAINEKHLGPEHPETAIAMNNLALLLAAQGNYAEAKELFERSLAIWKKVHGEDHSTIATGLNNLAGLDRSLGKYSEAQKFLEQSLAIWENIHGQSHPGTATAMDNLANVLKLQGDYADAIELYDRVAAIWEGLFGPDHPDTAQGLSNVAAALEAAGESAKAKTLYLRVLSIMEHVFGAEHPKTVTAINNLARNAYSSGNLPEALALYRRSVERILLFLDRELPAMSEAERRMILKIKANPERLLDCIHRAGGEFHARDYALFQKWKGKATRLKTAEVKLKLADQTDGIRRQYGELQVISKRLADLIKLPLAKQGEDHSEVTAFLRGERIRQEREINRSIDLEAVMAIPNVKQVQAGMPKNSILLDFFVGENVYAWVLPQLGSPLLLQLGSAKELAEAQKAFLNHMAIRGGRSLAESEKKERGRLYKLLWEPLSGLVEEAQTLLICPDGFLCELPFGILQQPESSFLQEKFRFYYLSDPTWPAREDLEPKGAEGAILAVGNINYFQREGLAKPSVPVNATRSSMNNIWESISGTKRELELLSDMHEFTLKWKSPAIIVQEEAATEERIRIELPGKRYVHIATHGYFEPDYLPSLLLDAMENNRQVNVDEQAQAVGLLPGLLSGLVFAGVNADYDPLRDDGYLTADEIQHIDLSACDLVVLSSCETALGSARAGEGLMSLRRAFSVAGADSVVSSLWKVEDRATAQLMKDF
ncbi:MAG: CHAT domain-containing protein [Planctomycetes bacterium]|nr:CHAT domain-containing protein [Planctomycetota bacterium]